MAKETNWKVYNGASKVEVEEFLRLAKELVWSRWTRGRKPKRKSNAGRKGYNRRGMTVLCMAKLYFGWDFRRTESALRAFPGFVEFLELEGAPSKSAIHRAFGRLQKAWLLRLNDAVVAGFKKSATTPASTAAASA